jgi:hypothetical protein
MDTTTETLLTGAIVIIGKWVQPADPKHPEKGHVTAQNIIGIIGAAVLLSLLSEATEKLARGIGGIMLLTAVFTYAVPILRRVGLIK